MKLKQLFMPLTGLAFVSLASPSYAAFWDYKTIPGAACQPQIGAQAGDFERYVDSIRNVSDTERTVICPMVRDTVTERNLDIGVTVTTNVRCTFHIMDYTGEQPLGQIEFPIVQPLDIDREIHYTGIIPASEIDPPGFQGYYALQCTLPPSGRVFSYISGELADYVVE